MARLGWWQAIRRKQRGKPRAGRGCARRRATWQPLLIPRFEQLEPRQLLSASPIGDTPYIDLGTSDNVAWDQPRATVELIVGEQVNVTPATLVFIPGEGPNAWDQPQTLTVTAIDDHDEEGPHSFTVKHTAQSDDTDFDGETSELQVGIGDNDPSESEAGDSGVLPGASIWFQITETGGSTEVTEGPDDRADTYTVVLTEEPSEPVVITLFDDGDPALGSVGPTWTNTWLLDTGANSAMAFASAVSDMESPPHVYATEGKFEELGVAGPHTFDISCPYRFDVAGNTGARNTVRDARILSDPENDISIFGPYGIAGMPAMAGRVTTLDMTVWTTVGDELLMRTLFGDSVPAPVSVEVVDGVFEDAVRYSVAVDNRVSYSPEGHVTDGEYPPVWADVPFLTAYAVHQGTAVQGNFLFDTGAQVSVLSVPMGMGIGLDSNQDGLLDDQDANFARWETVGGVGGQIDAPVFLFDEVHVPTQEGPDLVWTDLQWLVLDIDPGIDAVFGSDLVTSGWIEAFAVDGQSGWLMQVQLDFREMATSGNGVIHFDLNPVLDNVIDPGGPGALVVESGGWTTVSEGQPTDPWHHEDTYQIRLTQQPASDVTIDLSAPGGELIAVEQSSGQPFVVFTPATWDDWQTVVVSAVDDNDPESFHRSSIYHEVAPGSDDDYLDAGIPRVVANIIDDDSAGVMIIPTQGSTDVTENGNGDTYQVVLTKAPAPDKTVTIVLEHTGGQLTAVKDDRPGGSSLTFTDGNWNVPQTVRVAAVDDDLVEGSHEAYVTHRIDTNDFDYLLTYALQEPVYITDDDAPAPAVVGRHVFYNDSKWDESPGFSGGDPAANQYDDNAIASDKTALLPGQIATFDNYTSYSKGINGIMIDVLALADGENLSASDFTFKMGNDGDPGSWDFAPTPADENITVRPGAGTGGSDRVTIVWPNYDSVNPDPTTQAVAKQWLQVTVLDTDNTGLAEPDVFYFGNALGDSGTGNSGGAALVNAVDSGAVRDNPHNPFVAPAPIDDFADYNRDQWVGAVDFGLVRDNATNPSTALRLITAPAAGPSPGPEGTSALARIDRGALHDAAVGELGAEPDAERGARAGDDPYLADLSWFDDAGSSAPRSPSSEIANPTRAAVEKLLATL